MTLKRISGAKIRKATDNHPTVGSQEYYRDANVETKIIVGRRVAQAQLESCEKEHKAVIAQLFEEIENISNVERNEHDGVVERIIREGLYQPLKQKYGGE